jgi:3-hydroxyacyl-CoA dehydrogenase/3a,7a,12a-trihydroxy-5b-cholest-24-enoyl-CoA hydratase
MALDLSVVGKPFAPMTFEYTDREVMLYALGIGAGTDDLEFTFEKNLKVYPTFAVIPAFSALAGLGQVLTFNWAMLLHGEQHIELKGPIPPAGKLTTVGVVRAIYDKGSGALVVVDAETKDGDGKPLFVNTFGAFIRGEGGFGGDRGPGGPKNVAPQRAPDAVVEMQTRPDQALIYRLSGDRNPLHADPDFAKLAGFDRPILHGLCSFGHAGRAVLKTFCGNDPARLKSLEVRFSGAVFPGDTIVTEMWKESDTQVILQCKTQRGDVVLSSAAATVAP